MQFIDKEVKPFLALLGKMQWNSCSCYFSSSPWRSLVEWFDISED